MFGVPHPFIPAADSLCDWPHCIIGVKSVVLVNHPIISIDLRSKALEPEKILLNSWSK